MEGWCSDRGGDSIRGERRSHSKPVCGAEPEKEARRIAALRLILSVT